MKRSVAILLVLLAGSGCHTTPPDVAALLGRARLERQGDLPVLHLRGTPYEMGYQHGALLREEVRAQYAEAFRTMQTLPRVRIFTRWQVNRYLDRIWSQLEPHVPKRYREEMRGLADGSGVSLADIQRAHAVPEAFPTSCAVGAFWGRATADGRLYQFRNLDWNRAIGAHKRPAVFVVWPPGGQRFVNLGFAGFLGVLSGMNEAGLAVGQIGSRSADEWHRGTPFAFLLRRVLEEADHVQSAARIVRESRRTVGINYVIGSARELRALALETTAHHYAEFADADPAEAASPHAVPFPHAVFRADTAFDPVVRELQTCSDGDPGRPGLEDPGGSSAYKKRYLWQAEMVKTHYGRIGTNEVFALARRVAMKSNIQSVVYAYPDLWVAYAQGDSRAADGAYQHFRLTELLGLPSPP